MDEDFTQRAPSGREIAERRKEYLEQSFGRVYPRCSVANGSRRSGRHIGGRHPSIEFATNQTGVCPLHEFVTKQRPR